MQKESAAEIELTLKKKARRRLVGAITLVLMMLIILPIVLKDRVATTAQDDVKITIDNQTEPSPELSHQQAVVSDFDSKVVPADEPEVSQPIALPNQTENQASEAVKSTPENMATGHEPAPSATVAIKTDAETQATSVDPEAAPVKSTEKKSEAKLAESKPVEPKKEDVSQTDKSSVKKSAFFVQVGVFSDPNNVKQLQAKLSDLGYQSKTEKVNTPKGEKIRLKSQLFSSRNEAAIALENIKDAGLTGMVVSQ